MTSLLTDTVYITLSSIMAVRDGSCKNNEYTKYTIAENIYLFVNNKFLVSTKESGFP